MIYFYFLIYLFLEIFVTFEFSKIFTPFGTFLEVLATFFVGSFILMNLGFSLNEFIQRLFNKEISLGTLIKWGFYLIGVFLLILPGILSDIIGIVMILLNKPEKQEEKTPFDKDDEIIDVEIIEEKK